MGFILTNDAIIVLFNSFNIRGVVIFPCFQSHPYIKAYQAIMYTHGLPDVYPQAHTYIRQMTHTHGITLEVHMLNQTRTQVHTYKSYIRSKNNRMHSYSIGVFSKSPISPFLVNVNPSIT